MEDQDSRVRPMSEAENAAYRGVTVDEDGTAADAESPQAEAYRSSGGAYERAQRSSVRYVRIGGERRRSRRSFPPLFGGLSLPRCLLSSSSSHCPRLLW